MHAPTHTTCPGLPLLLTAALAAAPAAQQITFAEGSPGALQIVDCGVGMLGSIVSNR